MNYELYLFVCWFAFFLSLHKIKSDKIQIHNEIEKKKYMKYLKKINKISKMITMVAV